jgi:hypothetical protein
VAFGKEKLSVKRRSWILLGVLVAAMFVLAGCGVPFEGVDVATVPPDGPWQTFVVWPLANVLLWLDGVLKGAGVPYHWGFTIILFTLLVKLITFPLSLTQIRSMEAQKTLQPQLQDLQKKYGKDREALAQAQMKLYQESGVNPLSGCLPLVIQMPILFGLYAALVAVGPNLKNAAFFWIPDLSFPSNAIGLSWIPEAWQAGDYAHCLHDSADPAGCQPNRRAEDDDTALHRQQRTGQDDAEHEHDHDRLLWLFYAAGTCRSDPLLGYQQLAADAPAVGRYPFLPAQRPGCRQRCTGAQTGNRDRRGACPQKELPTTTAQSKGQVSHG